MKPMYILIALCIIFQSASVLPAAQISGKVKADSIFNNANQLYKEKQFSASAEQYMELVKSGYESSELFYNLGNAYYRQDKMGYAILYYEKALKKNPGDEDLLHNLALANSRIIDRIDALPPFFIFDWWESLLAVFTINEWTYIIYGIFLMMLGSAALYFFSKQGRVQRYGFYAGLALLMMIIFASVILIVNLNRVLNIKEAVIVQQEIAAKVSPDPEGNDVFIIHEGLKVRIEDKVDNWYKIRLQDGKTGWISSQYINII